MRVVVLDTHTLVWFLQKDSRLSKKALKLILQDEILKVIPFIVFCEIHHLHAHGKFALSAAEAADRIDDIHHFEIAPHSQRQLPHLLSGLEIHDSLIVATGLEQKEIHRSDVAILSRDEDIQEHSPIPVIWDD